MRTIPISSIIITNRQRRKFNEEALAALATSIAKKGLLHPIVLREDEKTLVAGERRCRAVESLLDLYTSITHDGREVHGGSIPYVTLQELSEEDLVEAELEENILREDLSWEEEAEAIARLHTLRVGQIPNRTYKDTAEELTARPATSTSAGKVRDSLLIQSYRENPAVMKAHSVKDALKVIKKIKQQELTNALAEQFDVAKSPHIFNNGDFRDFKSTIETSSVECIITDPPYGIQADTFGTQAGTSHEYTDTPAYFKEILADFIIEASRVTRDRAHLYLFCDPRWFDYITTALAAAGWDVWPVPLIWDKGNGMLPRPYHGPRRNYEMIVYAIKGDKEVTAVYPDVINISGLKSPRYGAEKPVELFENLMRRSCRPGDLVWDAFVGAGGIFPAGNKASIRVVGTELSEDKFNFAKLRMEDGL